LTHKFSYIGFYFKNLVNSEKVHNLFILYCCVSVKTWICLKVFKIVLLNPTYVSNLIMKILEKSNNKPLNWTRSRELVFRLWMLSIIKLIVLIVSANFFMLSDKIESKSKRAIVKHKFFSFGLCLAIFQKSNPFWKPKDII